MNGITTQLNNPGELSITHHDKTTSNTWTQNGLGLKISIPPLDKLNNLSFDFKFIYVLYQE